MTGVVRNLPASSSLYEEDGDYDYYDEYEYDDPYDFAANSGGRGGGGGGKKKGGKGGKSCSSSSSTGAGVYSSKHVRQREAQRRAARSPKKG